MRYHNYFVYIITNPAKTVLYTGVTNNMEDRLSEHYANRGNPETFAGKYHCYNLIYFERYENIQQAITREKEIKAWRREKKMDLIKGGNAGLKFLNEDVCEKWPPEEECEARSKYQ